MAKPFDTFDHTADIGLIARGATLEEVFEHAAQGLVDLIVDPRGLRTDVRQEVAVSAPDREALLVGWLNELLYLLDAQGFLPVTCEVEEITDTRVAVVCAGDTLDPSRHTLRRQIKAATLHGVSLTRSAAGWEARVILDL